MSTVGQTFPIQPSELNQDGQTGWGPLERDVLTSLIETVEQAVPVDGLDINGNLDMQAHGLVNASFVQMVLNGDAGLLREQFVDSNGDLWYRDGQNRPVQVTSGGTLAISVSTGGFAGDYITTNPSGATYDNSTGKFSFTAPSPSGQSAIINGGPIQLRQGADTDYVGLNVPASLPGTYDLLLPATLPADSRTIMTCDATGSIAFSISGTVLQQTPGRWIGRQVFTATGPYTPSTNANSLFIRMVGGGGGGGGAGTGTSAQGAAGGGGASGAYIEDFRLVVPISGNVYIGAAGAAGASTPGDGGTGGDTVFRITGSNGEYVYTTKGGPGGRLCIASGAPSFGHGGGVVAGTALTIGGGAATANIVSGPREGTTGMNWFGLSGIGTSGAGGSSVMGAGGEGVQLITSGSSPGKAAQGPGGGGGGGCCIAAGSAAAGGIALEGLVIIDEFR